MTVASSQKVGKVIDLSWAPLPQPVGGGSVVALALEDGSLAFADTSQAVEHSSHQQRMQAFKHLLGGSWPYPQVSLAPSLFMKRNVECRQRTRLSRFNRLGVNSSACTTAQGILMFQLGVYPVHNHMCSFT